MTPDPLTLQRAAVKSAEEQLFRARERMSEAARRLNIPEQKLFSGSIFVARGSAEAWERQARKAGFERGRAKGHADLIGVMRAMADPSKNRFAHLAAAVRQGLQLDGKGKGGQVVSSIELAAKILQAGKKARGEIVEPEANRRSK